MVPTNSNRVDTIEDSKPLIRRHRVALKAWVLGKPNRQCGRP